MASCVSLGAGARRPDTTQERNCRIDSIWWFVVKQVNQFVRTLRPRERANYEVDDILMSIWVHLAEKDHLWNPKISRYITFAGLVIKHELEELRNRSRIVHSPKGATGRLKQYEKNEANGTITMRGQATAEAIRRTQLAVAPLDFTVVHDETPDENLLLGQVREKVLGLLTMQQLAVMSLYLGLHCNGRPGRQHSIGKIAAKLGLTESTVISIKNKSLVKIREALAAEE